MSCVEVPNHNIETDKFKSLEELIQDYHKLVDENKDGLPPYARFKIYLSDSTDNCTDCINRPVKVKELIDCLAEEEKDDGEKLEAIVALFATGGDIHVKDEDKPFNNKKIIHSVSNTTRLQVFLVDSEKDSKNKYIVLNKDALINFGKEIAKYIKSFDENGSLKENPVAHNLKEKSEFKNLIKNNIDSVINEILFWYYYNEDKYPIINSRAKNSKHILKQAFGRHIASNDLDFNKQCFDVEGFNAIKKENDNEIYISKQLMLDQLFYTIDEMKSMQEVEKEYKDKNDDIYNFYRKLWKTIKDYKNVPNNADFFDKLLEKSKNIILYGAPGTGKTYTSEENIKRILCENKNTEIKVDRFTKVQFHPSYGYEDFIEGLKPVVKGESVALELKDGLFMQFCKKASEYEEKYKKADKKAKMKWAFFFLVDEINRAELSRVFGEVMYALEKRGKGIQTQYAYMRKRKKEFMIPENLYFIGTMNDVDRSIDSFDLALRRRFFWYRMDCDYGVIFRELEGNYENIGEYGDKESDFSGYLKACFDLNMFITKELGLGKLYELGHSYFLNIRLHTDDKEEKPEIENKDMKSLFDFSIEPLLKEYLRAEYREEEIEEKLKEAKEKFKINDSDS